MADNLELPMPVVSTIFDGPFPWIGARRVAAQPPFPESSGFTFHVIGLHDRTNDVVSQVMHTSSIRLHCPHASEAPQYDEDRED